MRFVYRIERIVDGVVVETIRPRESGKPAALRETRERAKNIPNERRRMYGPKDRIRLRNVSTDSVVVTYEKVDDKPRKV